MSDRSTDQPNSRQASSDRIVEYELSDATKLDPELRSELFRILTFKSGELDKAVGDIPQWVRDVSG
jgi:hypothetical protein